MFHSIAASIQLCMLSRDDGRYETSFSHAVVNPHDVLHILRVRGPLHVLLKLQPQRPRRHSCYRLRLAASESALLAASRSSGVQAANLRW